jgi:Na+/H+ antiporter NhaD/arsenite permease-like protein
MLLILLTLLLALLPLMLTTALPQLMIVSIYAGLAHLLALAWAMMVITAIVRRHRIAEWRAAKARSKSGAKPSRLVNRTQ